MDKPRIQSMPTRSYWSVSKSLHIKLRNTKNASIFMAYLINFNEASMRGGVFHITDGNLLMDLGMGPGEHSNIYRKLYELGLIEKICRSAKGLHTYKLRISNIEAIMLGHQ